MKRLLCVLLLSVSAAAQMPFRLNGNGGCFAPSGTTFFETLGDGGGVNGTYLCADGTSTCTNLWLRGAGTADAIAASPGTPIANTACANSLHIVQPGGAAGYIDSTGFFPTIAGVHTFGFSLNRHSDSLTGGNSQNIVGLASTATASNNACGVLLYNCNSGGCSGTRTVRGVGTSFSLSTGTLTIPADTWVNVTVKCDPTDTTLNKSCITTSGDLTCCGAGSDNAGTCYRFNARAKSPVYALLGDTTTAVAADYYIGNFWVSSAAGNASGDSAFLDAECSGGGTCTDGTATGTANMNGSTWAGNGAWTIAVAGWVLSTDHNFPLQTADNISGTSRSGAGTHAIKFDHSGTGNPDMLYTFSTLSSRGSYCFHWYSTWDPTEGDQRGFTYMQNVAGTDYAGQNLSKSGGVRYVFLEAHSSPSGTPTGGKYAYALNTEYVSCIQFNANGTHQLQIFDSSCNLLSTQTKPAEATTSLPFTLHIVMADTAGARTGITYLDSMTWNIKGNTMTCH